MNTDSRFHPKKIMIAAIITACFAGCLLYFNYFETPSEDYIGNIKPVVEEYLAGNFPGTSFKLLPFYPLLLALVTAVNPVAAFDRVYLSAIALNICLFVPFMALAWLIYRKFLSRGTACAALLFLGINIYTVFSAVNADLEMALSVTVLLTLHLSMKGSRLAYIPAFFAATSKWDSVFAVPAAMWSDFFSRGKRFLAIALGTLAASGVIAWFMAIFLSEKASSPYVKEIASRGPNIYRYLIDCFLITSGFGQWMASDAYFSKNMMVRIPLFSFLGAYLLTIVTAVIGGAALLLKRRRGDIAPVLVFLIGFLAIHMIYQNTKERYVIPILWLLTLFLFYGLSEWMFPALERAADRLSGAARKLGHPAGTIVLGAFFTAAAVKMVRAHLYAQLLLAAIFTGLLAAIVIYHGKGMSKRGKTFIIMAGGVVIGFMMYYGAAAMDHYSLRRVEFKKAGLWFREHAARGERMLITETNIAKYYTGLGDDAFYYAKRIESDTIESLAKELQEKKVKYVFVDDFYIRRYEFKDMNAIDRKAWLFRDIRDRGEAGGLFTPVASFETKGGIKSYLFRLGR